MASFEFTVDTTPMAQSVDSASRRLNNVTGAVTAMQAAVIACEIEASNKICRNVDIGFFELTKSQISQKAVVAENEMESKKITLLQLLKALDGIKRQMENDFHMITKRYAKLFGSLNKALENRIKELDRPATQLADIRKKMVFGKLKDDSSLMINISAEALPVAQTALSGKLKQKTREAMRTLSGYVEENHLYTDKVDNILLKNGNDFSAKSDQHFIPAIFFVADSLLNPNDCTENIFTPQVDVLQNTTPIVSELSRIQNDLNWMQLSTEEKERIYREFIVLCEKGQDEERLTRETVRLFKESVWENCKNELQ